jgi:transcriptional regulator with XRE-family HTH domain
MTIHPDQRHELAVGLRALREIKGVSTYQLAERLKWTQSRVSRVGRGTTLPEPDEVEAWARALEAPDDERRRLVALAEKARIQLTEWKREVAPGRRKLQAEIGTMESSASVVRLFGMDVVPGLAQTAPYAEMMFRLGQDQAPGTEDIAAVVDARLARQEVLTNPKKKFELLCTETAFHRNLIGRDAMLEQIQRVLEVAALPNVEFGVIPFAARERVHTYHAFAVIGDPEHDESAIVLAETVTRGLTIRAEEEVIGYIRHFNELAESAITKADLSEFLQEVAANAPWS